MAQGARIGREGRARPWTLDADADGPGEAEDGAGPAHPLGDNGLDGLSRDRPPALPGAAGAQARVAPAEAEGVCGS